MTVLVLAAVYVVTAVVLAILGIVDTLTAGRAILGIAAVLLIGHTTRPRRSTAKRGNERL